MTVSTETVRMAKSRPRKNQSERSDLPCHIIKAFMATLMQSIDKVFENPVTIALIRTFQLLNRAILECKARLTPLIALFDEFKI